jgi:hypothetical protein
MVVRKDKFKVQLRMQETEPRNYKSQDAGFVLFLNVGFHLPY